MTHKQDRASTRMGHIVHLAYRFFLEFRITDSENFVNDQNFRFQKCSDSKPQTDSHTRRIALNRGIYITFHTCKINDFI